MSTWCPRQLNQRPPGTARWPHSFARTARTRSASAAALPAAIEPSPGDADSAVEDGDCLDLDERVRDREVRDLHERARGRIRAEELRAHLAVGLAVADVGHEDRHLDDVVHASAAGFDDLLDLLEDASRLHLDVALAHQVAVLVVGELTRDVDRVPDAPAERVARALVLHVGRSNRDTRHEEPPIVGYRTCRNGRVVSVAGSQKPCSPIHALASSPSAVVITTIVAPPSSTPPKASLPAPRSSTSEICAMSRSRTGPSTIVAAREPSSTTGTSSHGSTKWLKLRGLYAVHAPPVQYGSSSIAGFTCQGCCRR